MNKYLNACGVKSILSFALSNITQNLLTFTWDRTCFKGKDKNYMLKDSNFVMK